MKAPDPREVLRLASAVVEAEDKLKRLRADWDALFAYPKSHDEPKGTLSDRILELLTAEPSRTYSAPEVSALLSANPNSVGPLLSRLVSEGKLVKVGYGEYRGRGSHDSEATGGDDLEFTNEGPVALPS